MSGTKDKVEGKFEQAKGKAKEKIGDAIDDEQMEVEGKVENTKGELKEARGNVKDAIDSATDK
ncbi:MAG: CsbD family protein [Pseudomonadota bacterium]